VYFEYNQTLQPIRARYGREHSGALPTQIFLFPTNSLAHFYEQHDHEHCIIEFCTPVTSLYIRWRNIIGIITATSGIYFGSQPYNGEPSGSTKPVARFYGLSGKYIFKGQDLSFYYMGLKLYFMGTRFWGEEKKFGGHCPRIPSCCYGH